MRLGAPRRMEDCREIHSQITWCRLGLTPKRVRAFSPDAEQQLLCDVRMTASVRRFVGRGHRLKRLKPAPT